MGNIHRDTRSISISIELCAISDLWSALTWSWMSSLSESDAALHNAAYCGDLEGIEAAMADGGNPNSSDCEQGGASALHLAAGCGHVEVIELLVKIHGAYIDAQGIGGWTPLYWAAQRGRTEAVRHLVSLGATVNKDKRATTSALHLATREGHAATAQMLIEECGASPDVLDEQGRTAAQSASPFSSVSPKRSPKQTPKQTPKLERSKSW